MTLPATVAAVVERLGATPGVERIRLFGSRARGDHGPWSDVDLAVDADMGRDAWARLSADVQEAETLYTIDLVWTCETTPDLRARIDAEGVALYDHQGRQRLDNFGRALARLTEALSIPPDAPLAVDGTVQRFEFTFELAWKTLKDGLAFEGIEAQTPLEVLRAAARAGWITDEQAWLGMLKDRNLASRTYNEAMALDLHGRIHENASALRAAHAFLSARYGPPTLL